MRRCARAFGVGFPIGDISVTVERYVALVDEVNVRRNSSRYIDLTVVGKEYKVGFVSDSRLFKRIEHHSEPSVSFAERMIHLFTENAACVALIINERGVRQ